jgi:hypothetical protein
LVSKISLYQRLVTHLLTLYLLGIRGVGKVLVADHMEGGFTEVLKATLSQAPGTDVAQPVIQAVSYTTPHLYGEGIFESTAYQQRQDRLYTAAKPAFSLYPTRTVTSKQDFSWLGTQYEVDQVTEAPLPTRHLADDGTRLAEHLLGIPEVDVDIETKMSTSRDDIGFALQEFEVDDEDAEVRPGRTAVLPATSSYGHVQRALGMEELVPISGAESSGADSLVELGWKV